MVHTALDIQSYLLKNVFLIFEAIWEDILRFKKTNNVCCCFLLASEN
jgi:hypothetical protein